MSEHIMGMDITDSVINTHNIILRFVMNDHIPEAKKIAKHENAKGQSTKTVLAIGGNTHAPQ